MQKGENELRISLNFTLNKFSWHSLQFSAFHGITKNDVIGTSLNNFFIPNQISYAHYWQAQNNSQNIQLHFNDLIASNFNPSLELDLGFSYYSGDIYNNFKVGVGYYGTPILLSLFGNSIIKHKIVPIFGYRFQHKLFSADVQLIPGMTNYFIRYYKDDYRKYVGQKAAEIITRNDRYVFSHSEVDTIIKVNKEYKIRFQSGDTLFIAERDPYADCITCGIDQRLHSEYLASESHNVYWIYWKDYRRKNQKPLMLELNMERIIENFMKGGDLELTEDENLTEETINRKNLYFHDFFFSIGRVEYQNNYENGT